MFADQWRALSGRIRGLVQATQLHTQVLAIKPVDSYGRAAALSAHAKSILIELEQFRSSFNQALPAEAVTAIDRCVNQDLDRSVANILHRGNYAPDVFSEGILAAIVQLAAFETEMTFILSDVQAVIRSRAERAFAHLQRLIVADAGTRKQWKAAFEVGEMSCEKLGAVHLLWHGLFAFKVDAAGGRTDLVFPERPVDEQDAERYTDGLVLTEWKVSRPDSDAKEKWQQARDQADCYGQGVLAGVELTTVRYAVVVSRQLVDPPANIPYEKGLYRHINIAVEPETPSQASRSKTRRT